jgi:ubiquinone/menaquinone biosynthesis C-methylase UbiE
LFSQLDNHFNFRIGQTTLEIGCGTGKATEHLASRGLTVTGIDIASDLLAIANDKLKGWKVRLLQSSFEEFRAPDASFNYIVAAQAFHWIDPAIASKKTRLLLKENGAVILIWNIRHDADSPERAAIDAVRKIRALIVDPPLAGNRSSHRNLSNRLRRSQDHA